MGGGSCAAPGDFFVTQGYRFAMRDVDASLQAALICDACVPQAASEQCVNTLGNCFQARTASGIRESSPKLQRGSSWQRKADALLAHWISLEIQWPKQLAGQERNSFAV